MRAWRVATTLLKVGFADAVAYRSEMLVWLLSTNTPVIMLFLWRAVAAEAPIGRWGEAEFTAYFLTTLVVRLLTGAWVVWEINMEVKSGELAMRLLRPLHPFWSYAGENLAAWPLRLLICSPIIVVALVLVGPAAFNSDLQVWLLFPLTLAGAWALTFAAMSAIGALSLFWQSSLTLFDLWMGLYFVLSGYVLPLSLFPQSLQPALAALPFRYLLSFPVETALGLAPLPAVLKGLAAQWTYVIAFFALALLLWQRGVRRYEAFGG